MAATPGRLKPGNLLFLLPHKSICYQSDVYSLGGQPYDPTRGLADSGGGLPRRPELKGSGRFLILGKTPCGLAKKRHATSPAAVHQIQVLR
jgi:hypothetical protein